MDLAIQYYTEACDLYEQEDRLRFSVDTYRKLVGVLIKKGDTMNAYEQMRRLSTVFLKTKNAVGLFKNYLSTVILLLHMGDEVEAGKQFDSYLR
jgi:hypothetical protein